MRLPLKKDHWVLIDFWCDYLEAQANQGTESKDTYFWFKVNKKYTKIIMVDHVKVETAHAFVDNKTLDIYKPASWNAPVKESKYNLEHDYEQLLNDCEWTGGYLYKNGVKKVKVYGC